MSLKNWKLGHLAVAGLLALFATMLLSIALRTVYVPPLTILKSMAQAIGLPVNQPADQTSQILILLIRLPRVLPQYLLVQVWQLLARRCKAFFAIRSLNQAFSVYRLVQAWVP